MRTTFNFTLAQKKPKAITCNLFMIPKMHLCSQLSDIKTIKSWVETLFKLYYEAKLENIMTGRGELLM